TAAHEPPPFPPGKLLLDLPSPGDGGGRSGAIPGPTVKSGWEKVGAPGIPLRSEGPYRARACDAAALCGLPGHPCLFLHNQPELAHPDANRPSLGVFPSPAGSPGFGSDTRTAPEEAAVLTLGSLWESVP